MASYNNNKHLRKLVAATKLLFARSFNPSKCKAEAKMVTARIKLLRNKRDAQIRQMRRDIATLLQSGQEDIARIRVEHVIREQNILAANEIIELFCELIVSRLSIISRQRDCPADLKEGISSIIYAAPRCSELPELLRIRDIFEKKYGKDFVTGAIELRTDSGVNRHLIEKLSVKKPTGEVKLKIMKAIAKEYQVEWDTTETEQELLKPPEERLEGPKTFLSASTLPITTNQPVQADTQHFEHYTRNYSYDGEEGDNSTDMEFSDTAAAAQAAAEFAAKAVSAANSAAQLSKQESSQCHPASFKSTTNCFSSHSFDGLNPIEHGDSDSESEEVASKAVSATKSVSAANSAAHLSKRESSQSDQTSFKSITNRFSSHSFDGLNPIENEDSDAESEEVDSRRVVRSHAKIDVGPKRVNPEINFDDSNGSHSEDNAEEVMLDPPCRVPPPKRAPPPLPKEAFVGKDEHSDGPKGSGSSGSRVHPKLPDYEELTARFESLRSSASSKPW